MGWRSVSPRRTNGEGAPVRLEWADSCGGQRWLKPNRQDYNNRFYRRASLTFARAKAVFLQRLPREKSR